jgi:hypothetical protein
VHIHQNAVNYAENARRRDRTRGRTPTKLFNDCLKIATSRLLANFDHFCLIDIPGAQKFERKFLKIDFGWEMVCSTTWESEDHEKVTLGKYFPKDGVTPARVIVYRGPIEHRAKSIEQKTQLVQEIITSIVFDALKVPEKYRNLKNL